MAKAKTKNNKGSAKKTALLHPDELPERYAVQCIGDCMAPEVADGTRLLVDKTANYGAGDLVVLLFKPDRIPAGWHQASLKKLTLSVAPHVKFPWKEHPESECRMTVVVESLNPRRQYTYEVQDLLGIHKCMGPV